MRIRRDAVLVSSVLFTIAFLSLIPAFLSDALTGYQPNSEVSAGWEQVAARLLSDLGVASLAIVFIGLVVTWTGYVKKVRWTWFVMLIIVWAWAFPLMIFRPFQLPLLIVLTLSEWLSAALKQPGPPRDAAAEVLSFSLMVVALIVPVRSFFGRDGATASSPLEGVVR